MKYTVADALKMIGELESDEKKIAALKAQNIKPLVNILIVAYSKKMVPLIPNDAPPPYTPMKETSGGHTYFLKESRKLKYFFRGWGGDHIDQMKLESMYINMLESVHEKDAEMIVNAVMKKKFKGITSKHIKAAYGDVL